MTTSSSFSSSTGPSILIIGVTGRTGLACLRHLASHPTKPTLNGFSRDPSKLSASDRALCTSMIKGDARKVEDVKQAFAESKADWVIVSIGNGDDVGKSDIRTASARAVVEAMQQPSFQHVQAVVVSSTGTRPSHIVVGLGIGKLIEMYLRHVLTDHAGQEAAFMAVAKRTVIVRATSLTDQEATGKLVEFGNLDKSPSIKTDRADLAAWIAEVMVGKDGKKVGAAYNVTGVKQ